MARVTRVARAVLSPRNLCVLVALPSSVAFPILPDFGSLLKNPRSMSNTYESVGLGDGEGQTAQNTRMGKR